MKIKNDILIKVLSLGVGLAVGIVLIAKVFFELSYDSFYKDVEQVYTIWTWYNQNGEEGEGRGVSGAIAVGFMNEVPGVELGTRTTTPFNNDIDTFLDEDGNKLEASIVCADTCFFKVFDRPILAGDPVKALAKFGTVMVSRSFAEKLMDGIPGQARNDWSSIIGKQLFYRDLPGLSFTVEGVFEDFPKNGTLNYDILLSIVTYGDWSINNWMGNDRYKGYVKLYPGVDPNTLSDAIRKMQEAHQPLEEIEAAGSTLKYYLKPFNKLHTGDPEVKTQIVLLSIVAALLILISLLNYILIVISSLVKRSKEVGVRKCYGAEGKHIYGLLSKEALFHIVLSLILAALIIFAGRGVIENLLGVPFQTLLVPKSVIAIVAVILFVLVISIVVPAELYQRIPVDAALKNYTENSRRWKLGLLGVQILINVFLVVMMLIIGRQYQKVSNSDPGYNYDNLYYLYIGDFTLHSRTVQTLEGIPEVTGVAASFGLPFQGSNGDNVYIPNDERELFNIADQYFCSDGFFELMDIPFVDGRPPKSDLEVAVDEKFVAKMAEFTDWSDGAVGKQVFITGHTPVTDDGEIPFYFTISGVYRSYLIGNLQSVDPRPSAFFHGEIGTDHMTNILFKVDPESLPKVRAALEQALEGREIEIYSYEEKMRDAYADSKKMRNTLALGALFSLLIALLGLVGFIRDESLRRSKEMAIRKINGATTRDILGVFTGNIFKLSLIVAVLASVGAFFVAQKWLQQFAEKVSLNPLFFICGTLLVLVIVLVVVVLNCLRIAHANPVESLKNE